MAIIDPDGLFGGDRLRRCSNEAQLHWPRIFLASNGFARIEINYAKIVGRAYATFNPVPSQAELEGWLQEYAKHYLLFVYESGNEIWGQWDTPLKFLPRFKTATDKKSPIPPESAYTEWKKQYSVEKERLPKCFRNVSEGFRSGVGVGVGVGVGIGVQDLRKPSSVLKDQEHPANEQSPVRSHAEFPLMAHAVREFFPETDDVFVMKLAHAVCQKCASANGHLRGDPTDSLMAEAVRKCKASSRGQTSAGLFLQKVPQYVVTVLTQGIGEKQITRTYIPPTKPPEEGNGAA